MSKTIGYGWYTKTDPEENKDPMLGYNKELSGLAETLELAEKHMKICCMELPGLYKEEESVFFKLTLERLDSEEKSETEVMKQWIQKAKALLFDVEFCVSSALRNEANELIKEAGGYDPFKESSRTPLKWDIK